ncbi:hypothetical protein [Hathewaya massiliensis]|uniref:hypothetical protein n=1 Tax=Hathewaya massiliensis TaxID=1964382 RepID=UPI00115A71F7|nr:hypothetical protein [Hathewaya massiliensis]
MNFSNEEYVKNLAYVEALFTLGGLSECGKSSAGKHLETLGIKRQKIIKIEREMMEDIGLDLSNGMKNDYFVELYKYNQEQVFTEFLFRLIEKMKMEKVTKVAIESLYRAPLGEFLKRELGDRVANIYIEAPIEVRAYREMLKINKKVEAEGECEITLEEMLEKVKESHLFKEKHNAKDVINIADYVVDNSDNVPYDEFLKQITYISEKTINTRK